MAEKTRGYALRIDVDADAGRVWTALTDNARLARWMSSNAKVSPREGGSFRASIDRETEMPSPAMPAGEAAVVDDLMLEPRGTSTLLRVLGSGFPAEPAWEPALRRQQSGWRLSLARLKVYLEKNMDGDVREGAK
jgi:hypothetical protein